LAIGSGINSRLQRSCFTDRTDYTGYDFWLTKPNQFNGNFQNADIEGLARLEASKLAAAIFAVRKSAGDCKS
jgi:hypothetical protein